MRSYSIVVLMTMCLARTLAWGAEEAPAEEPLPPLWIATFEVDVTPPLGTPLAYGPAVEIVDRLSARGIVLLGSEQPIVLCAVDWIGIANEAHDVWREVLAAAAETIPERVCVHALHQHDARSFDLTTERLLAEHGLGGQMIDEGLCESHLGGLGRAVRETLAEPVEISHVGGGRAKVDRVASNRRVLGSDGRVQFVRYSSCRIPEAIAAPEGVIDPFCAAISFWQQDRPVASLTYYATHPQSYYGQGGVSCDFVGLARNKRDGELAEAAHIHFNGASGNVAAGKYNDGSPENRPLLAERLAEGMRQAWKATEKTTISANDLHWKVVPVSLPVRDTLEEQTLLDKLADSAAGDKDRTRAATDLAIVRRMAGGIELR